MPWWLFMRRKEVVEQQARAPVAWWTPTSLWTLRAPPSRSSRRAKSKWVSSGMGPCEPFSNPCPSLTPLAWVVSNRTWCSASRRSISSSCRSVVKLELQQVNRITVFYQALFRSKDQAAQSHWLPALPKVSIRVVLAVVALINVRLAQVHSGLPHLAPTIWLKMVKSREWEAHHQPSWTKVLHWQKLNLIQTAALPLVKEVWHKAQRYRIWVKWIKISSPNYTWEATLHRNLNGNSDTKSLQ